MIQSRFIPWFCLASSNGSNCTCHQNFNNYRYSHKNCTTKIGYVADSAEFKETSQVYM